MNFELPDMPYAYDALEPHIDALTMEIHHSGHHNAYTNNLNAAIKANGLSKELNIVELLVMHNDIPAVRNNAGGWINHCMFWDSMSPDGGGTPSGDLAAAIETTFGSFDHFTHDFHEAAMARFGSGWVWLGVPLSSKDSRDLVICSTPNQDNPLMDQSCDPILGLDVWEHAYYKKYGPGRAIYIHEWWNVVDWDEVSRRYSNCQ